MAYFYHDNETGEQGYGGAPSEQEKAAGEDDAEELDPHEVDQL